MIQEANFEWAYKDSECLNLIMPWYSLPCLQWLKQQPTHTWDVFEFGGGHSTLWWRMNCNALASVDHDFQWAKVFGCKHIDSEGSYVRAACYGQFDCIIVDGVYREQCVEYCVDSVKSGGYLIIDNYDSLDYDISKTEELLKNWEKKVYNQPNHSTWKTAIFRKP